MTGVSTDQFLAKIALNGGGGGGGPATWGAIEGDITTQVDLATALDEKADQGDLTSGLAGKANTSHTHTVGQVTGLQDELDGKLDEPTGTASGTTFARGDGTWATPPNTTYTVISDSEATTGTATTARAVSAASLARDIPKYALTSPDDSVNTIQFASSVEDIPVDAPEGSVWLTITGA